jgi:hypothetical protein
MALLYLGALPSSFFLQNLLYFLHEGLKTVSLKDALNIPVGSVDWKPQYFAFAVKIPLGESRKKLFFAGYDSSI